MKEAVDSLIVISNDKLLRQFGGIELKDSFMYADKTLKQTIRTITDIVAIPALINLDFADVSTVMKNKGDALIGIGKARGEDRAIKAATHAISSPILEASISGATDAIINIAGGNITLDEANKAVETIKQATGSDLHIIFGVSIVESLDQDMQVSVIATGLEKTNTISEKELRSEVANAVETIDIDFENEKTRELLVTNPLPEEEKFSIEDEVELQNSPFEVDDQDDEDELPAFLRD